MNVLLKLNWCLTSHLIFRLLNHTICKSWKSCVILFNVFLFFFPGGGMSIAKRKSILVSFYKSVVGTLFPPHELAASLTGTPVAYTLLETDQGFKARSFQMPYSAHFNAIQSSLCKYYQKCAMPEVVLETRNNIYRSKWLCHSFAFHLIQEFLKGRWLKQKLCY